MEAEKRGMDKNEEDLRRSPERRDDSGHCLNMCDFSYNTDFALAAGEGGESDA